MKYREDIDGLRAIAVVPVIFFHAGWKTFSGGYVGVDVFFVISGFLITSIIKQELQQQKFSLVNFYERRARRILPALMFMSLVTLIAALILMEPIGLKEFGASIVNVFTFTSNVYFWLTSGYFESVADEKPLLHTWSLAVEEQFYLIFPLMLMMFIKRGQKFLVALLTVIALISLAASEYLLFRGESNANFYLIISRAWELMVGSILAFLTISDTFSRSLANFFSLVGLLMILFAVFLFDEHTPFPGLYALMPVIGTALIIFFSTEKGFVHTILTLKPFIFIGLLSYSLYLWHQPVFAFLRLKIVGEPDNIWFMLGIVLSVLFSWISFKYVETPFRKKNKFDQRRIFTFSISGMLFFVSLGTYIFLKDGLPYRFAFKTTLEGINYSPMRNKCHTKGEDYLPPENACRYFNEKVEWAVLGDSHGVELAHELAILLNGEEQGLLHLTFSACPAVAGLDVVAPRGCQKWFDETFDMLIRDHEIKHVVMSYRYSYHLFGDHLKSFPEIPNKQPLRNIRKEIRKELNISGIDYYWEGLKKTIDKLIGSGKKVYLVLPIPELPMNIKKGMAPLTVFSERTLMNLERAVSIKYYQQRNAYILEKIKSLSSYQQLFLIDPTKLWCDSTHCPAAIHNKALYADDNHLSLFGAGLIAGNIILKETSIEE